MSVLGPENGFAADDASRAARLALVRSGHRVQALAWSARDPVVLSRLGMHASASDGFLGRRDLEGRWPADVVISHFAAGRAEEARRVAAAGRPSRRLALAAAPLDCALALSACPESENSLRYALSVEGGQSAPRPASSTPEIRLLTAWAERDGGGSSDAWADLFAARDMVRIHPPGAGTIRLNNATAKAEAAGGEIISVVMPVRNAASYVATAVRSVLDQGWRDLELLLVDDHSDDDTIDRALEAAVGDARLTLIRQSRRGGPYVARNRALTQARGRWVAFQDADEWAHPDRLRIQRQAMIDRDLIASVGRSVRIDASGRPRARGVWPLVRWAPSTLMIDREPILARAGLMHEVLSGADSEYWWRMVALFGPRRVANLRQLLILGAWRSDSLTGSAESGYGADGVNLDRLAYWEAWNRWHVAMRRTPEKLRLETDARPFTIPPGLAIAEGRAT